MTVYQLPVDVMAFAHWLTELAARLRPDAGWYGVFADRDPDGLRACFDGTEILPWDVVESLLQDAGEPADGPLAARAGTLYAAAATAHDRRPGGAAALAERRGLMERERRYAESRARELGERLRAAAGAAEVAALENDLAWIRDDQARAAARVAELTARLTRLDGTAGVAPERTAGRANPPAPTRPPASAAPTQSPSPAAPAWALARARDAATAAPAPTPAPTRHLLVPRSPAAGAPGTPGWRRVPRSGRRRWPSPRCRPEERRPGAQGSAEAVAARRAGRPRPPR
ncbi:hypothetical protein R1T08_35380 [Streptomyces sp. SBC-4]|nr:hypothetical protein [Streptomyces sp. SBC-4]MDV5149280.1 hypothetical protein [Streptomyces sp. SBC-4]